MGSSTLAEFVRVGGPLRGPALHRVAVRCAAAMVHTTSGVRLRPDEVALGPGGQVLVGCASAGEPADDVRAWADLVVFAATGAADGDVRVLPPVLRIAVERCRHPGAASRPRAADLVRVLLGRSVAAAMASVDDLLSRAG
ncbi:hypothetical protein E1286_14060 [Nonomuraea terrae]|uniref:Uncharacterized protein n=1 Tax=Nonomuraea terrae TaxID=2530383 RepID=A0A4R4YWR9_9ACTN|nr:hypothetical protein [Nonomuraea terrae]TDD49350.1 hypothetical protein E1286_14060 [Nonomuraea terrae]